MWRRLGARWLNDVITRVDRFVRTLSWHSLQSWHCRGSYDLALFKLKLTNPRLKAALPSSKHTNFWGRFWAFRYLFNYLFSNNWNISTFLLPDGYCDAMFIIVIIWIHQLFSFQTHLHHHPITCTFFLLECSRLKVILISDFLTEIESEERNWRCPFILDFRFFCNLWCICVWRTVFVLSPADMENKFRREKLRCLCVIHMTCASQKNWTENTGMSTGFIHAILEPQISKASTDSTQ